MVESKRFSVSDFVIGRGLIEKLMDTDSVWATLQALDATELTLVATVVGAAIAGGRKVLVGRRPP